MKKTNAASQLRPPRIRWGRHLYTAFLTLTKQYATDTVDRTPYMDAEGQVKYHEKIIKTLPKPPARKDRM